MLVSNPGRVFAAGMLAGPDVPLWVFTDLTFIAATTLSGTPGTLLGHLGS